MVHLQLLWFCVGLVLAAIVFFVGGMLITLFSIAKRSLGWLLRKDHGQWEPFPNGPRFWNWIVYAIVRVFLGVRVRPKGVEVLRGLDRSRPVIVFANHPTEIEFPFCYRMMIRYIPHAMLSTQAGWNRYVIMGPLFDLAGSAIPLRRTKDGFKPGAGRVDLRDGLWRLWRPGKALTIHPDSNRPSPSRIQERNNRFGTSFELIVSPRVGGVQTILEYLDDREIKDVPIVLFTSGFGLHIETNKVSQWFRAHGKEFLADFSVVSSDSLPRGERELSAWLGAWASGCDSKLRAMAKLNGFTS